MNIHHLLSPAENQGESKVDEESASRTRSASSSSYDRSASELHLHQRSHDVYEHANITSAPTQSSPLKHSLPHQDDTFDGSRPQFRSTLSSSDTSVVHDTRMHSPRAHHAQRYEPARTISGDSIARLRDQSAEGFLSPTSAAQQPPFSRTTSRQSLADLTMAEAPAQMPVPRDVSTSALSEEESQTVKELLSYLTKYSYAYDQHVQLISLLHKGFVAHAEHADPRTYVLLEDLRQSREAMDTRFAIGEDLWREWLADETILASSGEERIGLVELFQRATQDEPASVRLWIDYATWATECYSACHELEGADLSRWTVEDRELCRELFTQDMLFTLLEQASQATQWRIDSSHEVWNRYIKAMQDVFPESPSAKDVDQLIGLYVQRLQIPHAQWDETSQMFWPVLSKHRPADWEAAMNQMRHEAEPGKRAMAMREEHEFKLEQVLATNDRTEILAEYERYFKWEKKPKKNNPFEFQLRCALYERVLLKFPTAVEWWIDYVDYCISTPDATQESLLPLIERATRHCPWSGELWGRRILRADVERKSRDEIEAIKHRATSAGMLDMAGLDEMIKMLQQWCSYLRRHAFRRILAEDDLDTAEVGITMALEDVLRAGRKLYGDDFKGDNEFRLEQVQIKFYTEGRRVQEARAIYRSIAKHLGHSFDFWNKWYNWELWLWGYDRMTEQHRVETEDNGPDLATGVAREALNQRNLDFPEKVLEMYLYHFTQHESGVKLQAALVDAREFTKRLTSKRAREAEEGEHSRQQQQAHLATLEKLVDDQSSTTGEKRKREDDADVNGSDVKKTKLNGAEASHDASASAAAQARRDREHNTITIKNLPPDVQEKEISHFFRDVGRTLSVSIITESNHESAAATVEFASHDDVLAAKTRDGKPLRGFEVQIRSGGLNTLYVCNYPPEYDEEDIRGLFKAYGEIVSVRFPSLKYNNRRRFCYVTFLTPEMAKAAETAMDDKKLDSVHTLLAKISDPDHKKQKSGPQAEGREVFVRNLERNASEEEVKTFFAQYGTVERMNLLRSVTGQKLGTGFIIYTLASEAESAVEHANNKPFLDRILQVEIAKLKGGATAAERAKKTDVIVKHDTASPEPLSARRASDVSMSSSTQQARNNVADNEAYKTVRERKIAIFDLPETVNDARIRVAMEKYGPITKIQLRRDCEGAIVEFATQKDAFNVRQSVDVSSLGEGVYTGDVGDLLRPERKKKKGGAEPQTVHENRGSENLNEANADKPKPSALGMRPLTLGRGSRGGKRGGLGAKGHAGVFGGGRVSTTSAGNVNAGATSSKANGKSNDDFRKMLEESRPSQDAAE